MDHEHEEGSLKSGVLHVYGFYVTKPAHQGCLA